MKNVSLSGAPQLCTSGSRDRTYISGTGAALPSIRLTNEDLSGFLDTSDDWITERVGIKCRYICSPKETTVSMAEDAARQALMQAGLSAEELDLIVFATVTPDQQLPSAAALLAQRLGVNNTLAFDVKAACAGFLAAMATADSLLQSMGLTHALVIGSESLSRMIDWSDRTTAVLFGDGAGACILSRPLEASAGAVVASHLCTDGSAAQFIERPGKPFPEPVAPATAQLNQQLSPYVRMSGREVFRAGIQHMTSSCLLYTSDAADDP